jgi:putative membrane protein
MPAATESTVQRFEVRPTPDSHYSWLRTRMSAERTLMSWLRTGLAMIGFGFTIAQFLDKITTMAGAKGALYPAAPRYIGLGLIAAGTLALLIATVQYRQLLDYLWSDTFRPIAPEQRRLTSTYSMTIIVLCIGVLLFVGTLF